MDVTRKRKRTPFREGETRRTKGVSWDLTNQLEREALQYIEENYDFSTLAKWLMINWYHGIPIPPRGQLFGGGGFAFAPAPAATPGEPKPEEQGFDLEIATNTGLPSAYDDEEDED